MLEGNNGALEGKNGALEGKNGAICISILLLGHPSKSEDPVLGDSSRTRAWARSCWCPGWGQGHWVGRPARLGATPCRLCVVAMPLGLSGTDPTPCGCWAWGGVLGRGGAGPSRQPQLGSYLTPCDNHSPLLSLPSRFWGARGVYRVPPAAEEGEQSGLLLPPKGGVCAACALLLPRASETPCLCPPPPQKQR